MNPILKGLVLVVLGAMATGVAMVMSSIATQVLLAPHSCAEHGRTAVTSCIVMGVLVGLSLLAMILAVWRLLPGIGLRAGVFAVHATVVLAGYAFLAFTVMLGANC